MEDQGVVSLKRCLTEHEVRLVLSWAAATDFEAKLEADDYILVQRLARAIGEDPDNYAVVFLSTH
jgi:hypothetical protein